MIIDALSPCGEIEMQGGGIGYFDAFKQMFGQAFREDLNQLTFRMPGAVREMESVSFYRKRPIGVVEAPHSHGSLLVVLSILAQALGMGRKVIFLREAKQEQDYRHYVMSLLSMYPDSFSVLSLEDAVDFSDVTFDMDALVVVEHCSLLKKLNLNSLASVLRVRATSMVVVCNSAYELVDIVGVPLSGFYGKYEDCFSFCVSYHSKKVGLGSRPVGEFLVYDLRKLLVSRMLVPRLGS